MGPVAGKDLLLVDEKHHYKGLMDAEQGREEGEFLRETKRTWEVTLFLSVHR
jgi:hypothetical protein